MTTEQLLDRLVKVAPPVLARFYVPSACIATARIIRTVLARSGVTSTPLAVTVDAKSAQRWVHIGPESTGPDWSGHLVVDVGGRMLDLTIAQVNRPGLSANPFWTPSLPPVTIEQPGAQLTYDVLDDDGWRASPNWASDDPEQRTLRRAAISGVLAAL